MKTFFYSRAFTIACAITLMTSCTKSDSNDIDTPIPLNISSSGVSGNGGGCGVCPSGPPYQEPAPYTILPSNAAEIAVSGNATAVMISIDTQREINGGKIYYRDLNSANTNAWTYLPSSGAKSITAGTGVWIVDNMGRIFFNTAASSPVWNIFQATNQPLASAIACDWDEGRLFILGTTPVAGGYPVYRYDQPTNSWAVVGSQGGVRIHVDVFGSPWIVTNSGEVYYSAGYGQTFNGWNSVARPNNDPVIDIAQLKYSSDPNNYYAMAVLSKSSSTQDANYSTVYVHQYPSPSTPFSSTSWTNMLTGTGKRIAVGGGSTLLLIDPMSYIWRRPI